MTKTHKINTFDKAATQTVMTELDALLADFAATHGISISKVRGTYGGDTLKFSAQFATIGENGAVNTAESQAWKAHSGLNYSDLTLAGFTADDLGAEFTSQGKVFVITGYKSRARKRPLLAKQVGTDNQFVFPLEAVARLMGKTPLNLDDQPFTLRTKGGK